MLSWGCQESRESRGAVMPPVMLCDRQGYTHRLYPDRRIVPFELDVLGRRLSLAINYAEGPVTLADLVPMARALSDLLNEQLKVTLEGFRRRASCRQHCAHCCYYLVPVSPAEAFRLSAEVLAMPNPQRRALVGMFRLAGRRLLKRLPDPGATECEAPDDARPQLQRISDWYASLYLACPFLVNNLCAIYGLRPLACREYWVTSDPSHCHIHSRKAPTVAPLPVRIAEVLADVCHDLEATTQSLLLPLALPFAESQPKRAMRTWPAQMAVERFLHALLRSAHQNSLQPDESLLSTPTAG